MSSPEPEHIFKAGHGPAQRIGNMRVKQHKRQTSKENPRRSSESDDGNVEELSTSPPKSHPVVAGAQTKGDADFPPEAIRIFHEKPLPHCDFRAQPRAGNIIHQPKKF